MTNSETGSSPVSAISSARDRRTNAAVTSSARLSSNVSDGTPQRDGQLRL